MIAKRAMDVAVASLALLVSAPLLLLLAALVAVDSPGGAFFKQTRVGRNGRPFTIYKLRTFRRESHGFYKDEEIRWNDPRVTRAGNLLRRCKLDELPQLWNVLRGDMSLVGPRPDIPVQAESYRDYERSRLCMRPGMTGLAQVSGNTFLSWPERIQLDVWYIGHYSLWLDVVILLHTLPLLLRGEKATDDPLRLRQWQRSTW
jgi:lipopolysaccharide/colanic/teichoic acid biosynthesis glycosyltransferase